MGRRVLSIAAILLWLGAGAAFAIFGDRSMELERDAARRNLERIDRATLEGAVRMLPTVVSDVLEHDPTDRFVLADVPDRGDFPIDTSEPPIGLAQASYLERAGRPAEAEEMLVRVASEETRVLPRLTALLRAGALARARDDWAAAEPRLREAAKAYPFLTDADGLPIALIALRHLAPVDVAKGIQLPMQKLFAASKRGTVVRLDGGLTASDLLVAAADEAGIGGEMVEHARLGRQLVRATAEHGVAVVGNLIAYRPVKPGPAVVTATIARIEERLRAVLRSDLRVDHVRNGAGPWIRRAPAPLETLSLRLADETGDVKTPAAAVLVWTIGLGLYVLGGLLTILWVARNARASRMQAEFVASVSHEMKTPIAGIQAMAEMLADGRVTDPARAHAYAERIRAEASRLGANVRNVLDAARIERDPSSVVHPVPVEPSALVEDLASVMRPVLEGRGFRFAVTASPSPRPIPIDPDSFGSVVGNLLDNAAKFTGETKEIDVEAGPVANGYRVAVADRGPGVPRDERAKIFDRFERGEHARQMAVPGVGLGLHVAKTLMKAHGGTIFVADREGGGAIFVVEWPGGAS